MSYAKNVASNFATQIVIIILSFLTSIIVTRVLGPNGKGYISYIFLIINLLSNYGHFGINNSTTFFQKRSKYGSDIIFSTNVLYLSVLSIIIFIIVSSLRFLNLFLVDYSYILIIGALFIVFCTFLFNSFTGFYIGDERITEVNTINIKVNVLRCALDLLLWITKSLNVYSYVVVEVLVALINMLLLYRNLKLKFSIKFFKFSLLKDEFKYGIIVYLSALFMFLTYRVDQIFIKNMLGLSILGIYAVSVTLAEILLMIPESIVSAITGKLYSIDDNSSNRKSITSITVKYDFYVCLVLGCCGILCTPLIPVIYGKSFTNSVYPTIILIIGIVFSSIGKISCSYFQTLGKPKIHLYFTGICFAMNVILNFTLIPLLGINGAALASTISYVTLGIIYISFFILKEKFDFADFFYFNDYDKNLLKKLFINVKKMLLRKNSGGN